MLSWHSFFYMLYISCLFGLHACGAAIIQIQHVIVDFGLFYQVFFI